MQQTVEVTAADMLGAANFDSISNPIARAIRRCTGRSSYVYSDYLALDVDDGEETKWYELPYLARQWIRAFDRGLTEQPFTFELPMNEI